jgi:GNAT superfamily N-acetyltransferase
VTILSPPAVTLQEIAEDPDHYLDRIPAAARRHVASRFTLVLAPSNVQSATSRVRATAADLDDAVAEVRRVLRDAGIARNVWQVGPSSRPEGLARSLAERGFVPATKPPYEPTVTAMALAHPPAVAASAGVEVRLARDIDEYRQAIGIAMKAFNETAEDAAAWMEAVPSLWAAHDGVHYFTHLAFLDGRPVGFGFSTLAGRAMLLGGSGVLEEARRRGVYRALVAARWENARRLGHEGLIIHAGSMSKPILERCGFDTVCTIDLLEDTRLLTG